MSDHTDESSFDEPTVETSIPGPGGTGTGSASEPRRGTDSPSSDAHPVAAVHAGQVFAGRYRLEQQLAQRGGTLTWRAFDSKLSRSVLVHVLAPHDPRTASVLDAARRAAVATDSRFLRVLDAVGGDNDDEPSLVVCEYAPGQSLEHLLHSGPLSSLESAWVVRELADSLAAMHDVGLFHQRLNPDTVIITATGNVKIVGFLIEAALHPEISDQAPWAEREAADVRALGKLLYACLTGLWPAEHGAATWGLAAAPSDSRGWVPPRTITPGTSPALDAICDQVLSRTPRHQEMRLTSAKQVAASLGRVLGTADAAADLERRLRFPMAPVRTSTRDAWSAGRQAVAGATAAATAGTSSSNAAVHRDTDGPRTELFDTPSEFGRPAGPTTGSHPAATTDPAASHEPSPPTGASDAESPGGADATAEHTSRRPHLPVRPEPGHNTHRIAVAAVGLVLLSLLIGIVGLALGGHHGNRSTPAASGAGGASSSSSAPASSSASAQPSGKVQTIVSATDFDPTDDGGSGEENHRLVPLAHDGDPTTAWRTVTYTGSARFGGLKKGLGYMLDLGQPQQVGSVKLTMLGQPTGVQLMVPSDTTTSTAPTRSVKQWRSVASNPAAGTSVTLTASSPTLTRYVLVYFTSLPSVGGGSYRGGIAEVQVLS